MRPKAKKAKLSDDPTEPVAGPSGLNSTNEVNETNEDHEDDKDDEDDEDEHQNPHNDDGFNDGEYGLQIVRDEDGSLRIGNIWIAPPPKQTYSLNSAGPRLIITKIRNINFKSYAGTEELGPFHESFTSIIGPNGSGKSNVIDSMLFVFGYRASKIRSKNLSVLIHSSSKFPNCTSTTVEVHFCQVIDGDGNTHIQVPGSEMVISRTANKDNSSFYLLNYKRVPFKEVAIMLESHGIDLIHNRFLILQGEVETIAMMKPRGMTEHETGLLEFLEDVIGTSRFKEPLKKLADLENTMIEKRKVKQIRAKNADLDKHNCLDPMNRAVDLLNKFNAVVRMNNWVLQKRIYENRKFIAADELKLGEVTAVEAKLNESLGSIQAKLRERRELYKAASVKQKEVGKKNDLAQEKLNACLRKLATAQAEIDQAIKYKKIAEPKLEQEKKKLIEFELIPEKYTREIEELERLQERKNESKATVQAELEAVVLESSTRTQAYQEEKEIYEAQRLELKGRLDEVIRTRNLAETNLQAYLSNEVTENKKLQKLKDSLEKAEKDLVDNQRKYDELRASLPQEEANLDSMKARLQVVKSEEVRVETEFKSLRDQLVESRQAMTANRSRGRVLDALLKEKREGRLPGIFGRLGDLGGIDNTYDVAISTCCGALDNVVVDNVDTAQACIEFLKRNNIGFATFIALDKQEHLKRFYERPMTYAEGVPRLFDLVRVRDARVLPAFYYALRDTLVCRDLDQASRIAYAQPRRRAVSLQGHVIEIAGTMSGGGKTVMRGRMGSSVQQDTRVQDPVVIEAYERNVTELEAQLRELRAEHVILVDNIANDTASIQESKKKIKIHSGILNNLAGGVPSLRDQVIEQESKVVSARVDPVEKARLVAMLQEATERQIPAEAAFNEVQTKIRDLDTQISEVGGDRVKHLTKKVNDLTRNITKITREITKLRIAVETSKNNAKETKAKVTEKEASIRQKNELIDTMKAQMRTLTEEKVEFQRAIDELREEVEKSVDEIKKIKGEMNKLELKESRRKSDKLDVARLIAAKTKSLEEHKKLEARYEIELASLYFEDPGVGPVPNLEEHEPLKTYTGEELENVDLQGLETNLEALKKAAGNKKANLADIREYAVRLENYLNKVRELELITNERENVRNICGEVKIMREGEFMRGIYKITDKLKELYRMITLGGDADLELIDSMCPFTEGILFTVRPPNKSWKNISNLSGGEKTLSSLALVFALHYYKPSPLYVMDEIDAALDFRNVSIVSNYIKERTKDSQFIVISLRYNMFDACDRLIGIYKTDDCTKSITMDNKMPNQLTVHRGNQAGPST